MLWCLLSSVAGEPEPHPQGGSTQPAVPILCAGEPYVVQKSYTAVEEDELTLKEGDTIEVIHKLLDGWWVIR